MQKYLPLNVKTHFSILKALSQLSQVVATVDKCVLADINSLAGSFKFKAACHSWNKDEEKEGNKEAILGCDLGVDDSNDRLIIIAKNKDGWKEMMLLSSTANLPSNVQDGNPVLNYDYLKNYLDSENLCFVWTHKNEKFLSEVKVYKDHFIGIDLNKDNYQELRQVQKYTKVAAPEILYMEEWQRKDLQVIKCLVDNVDLKECSKLYPDYFGDKKYHYLNTQEMLDYGYYPDELKNTLIISEKCTDYSVYHPPMLPKYECPGGLSSKEYILQLARQGFRDRVQSQVDRKKFEIYGDRVRRELDVIIEFDLIDYFLIIRDILEYAKKHYNLAGVRGSAAGCLVSYLIGITDCDPIKHNLVFERFLNTGRMSKEKASLPDVDIDITVSCREPAIKYLVEKYGEANTGQIVAYNRIKAASAIKIVMKAHGLMTDAQINVITKQIIEEHKITDKLKDMEEPSLLRWSLENEGDKFRAYAYLGEDGSIQGEYAEEFKQAIRLEKTNRAISRHAAGFVVSSRPLSEVCSMIYCETDHTHIIGFSKDDAESAGLVKLDLLGLRLFDKINDISQSLANRPYTEFL